MTVSAETLVPLEEPETAFNRLCAHIEEHGVPLKLNAVGDAEVNYDGFRLEIAKDIVSLRFTVSAQNANYLYFIKEAVVRHLAEIAPDAARELRWSDASVGSVPINLCIAYLADRELLQCGMIRLRLGVEDVTVFEADGLHVKLMIPEHNERMPIWPKVATNGVTIWPDGDDQLHVRYYTIRAIDSGLKQLTVDVVVHDHGRIAQWAQTAQIGTQVGLMGPAGGKTPDVSGKVLLAGDMTAIPAIARILDDWAGKTDGVVIVPQEAAQNTGRYIPNTSMTVITVPEVDFHSSVLEEVRNVKGIEFAWFGGEFQTAQAMRDHFKRVFALGKSQQLSVSYWRKGQSTDAAA